MAQVRKQLREVYGEKAYKAEIADLDDEHTIELARNLGTGVPFASPVFDGAHEADIVELLKMADLDASGQVTLEAVKKNGVWSLTTLKLKVDCRDDEIDLLKESRADVVAPEWRRGMPPHFFA